MRLRHLGFAVAILASFLAGTLVPTARTESKPVKYLEVDYMKVEQGKEGDYVKLERDLWKPLHQERVKQGKLRSWSVYAVQFPSGADEKYNFVTVNEFNQFADLENPYANAEELLAKVHPQTKVSEFLNRTESARRLARSEVWSLIDHVE